jgi:hypothetical protein
MEGGDADRGSMDEPRTSPRRTAAGQVWIACALCRRAVELTESVQTPDGRVCRECAPAL